MLDFLLTLGGFAAAIVVVAELVNRAIKASGFGAQLVAWVLGIGIAVLADVLNLGMFVPLSTLESGAVGLAAGFVANGIFDVPFIQTILEKIGIRIP